MIKQARARNITRLSDNGRTSKAAAKSSKMPAPVRIAVQMQVFLDSIRASFFYFLLIPSSPPGGGTNHTPGSYVMGIKLSSKSFTEDNILPDGYA